MTVHRRVGSRAPLIGLTAVVLALLLLPTSVLAADWTVPKSMPSTSRLDSLHQLASARGIVHLVHPRVGARAFDDRVLYQRSTNDGRSWSAPQVLFKANKGRRHVVPNLALDARNKVVVVAYRVSGPKGHALYVRTSRDGGSSFGRKVKVSATTRPTGIGVPAVAVGNDFIAVAWTNRVNGKIKVSTSRDGGRSFGRTGAVATTKHSIDCTKRVTDGLVGLAASDSSLHIAWSHAGSRQCYASAVRTRTSANRGTTWSPVRTITKRDSFGWPELDARGNTVVAAVQGTDGSVIVARSGYNGRKWRDRVIAPEKKGRSFSAADVTLAPGRKAWISYVNERIEDGVLRRTSVITRRSTDDGASYGKPKAVTPDQRKLRQAPNIVIVGKRPVLVVQSGALDGSPRRIHSSRYR